MSKRTQEREKKKTNKENFKRMPRANPIKLLRKENSFQIKRLKSSQLS